MIEYIIPSPNSEVELPEHIKAGISVMAYDGWQFAEQAGADAAQVPTSVVGEVTIITDHEERFDGLDAIHVLAQALGAAIHDYKGCDMSEEKQKALIEEAGKHISHGVGIAHAMDERRK